MNEDTAIIVDDTDDELEGKEPLCVGSKGDDHPEIPSLADTRAQRPPRRSVDSSKRLKTASNSKSVTTTHLETKATGTLVRHEASHFQPAQWPHEVTHLRANYNPDAITFPFSHHFGMCKCTTPCRHDTCSNGVLSIFCTPSCCPFRGRCGNGLHESDSVTIVMNPKTRSYAIAAREDIPAGIILGQYLGRLTLEPPRKERIRNTGYRLQMKQTPKQCGRWRLCIDAGTFGSKMRFVNHSCRPNADFVEVSNGLEHTVKRPIKAGTEVTVNYGDDLSFVCRCGYFLCRHRDMQNLPDP